MGHACCCDCGFCKFLRVIVSVLLLLVTIAAGIAVWRTHALPTGWTFGTTEGTLAIIAFAFTLTKCFKTSKKLCPTCGSGCNCPTK